MNAPARITRAAAWRFSLFHNFGRFPHFSLASPPLRAGYCLVTKEKGQRVVNVKDFGAAGDGVHDDTDAVLQALDAARTDPDHELFFPPGTYRINGACDSKRWFRADEPDGDGEQ